MEYSLEKINEEIIKIKRDIRHIKIGVWILVLLSGILAFQIIYSLYQSFF